MMPCHLCGADNREECDCFVTIKVTDANIPEETLAILQVKIEIAMGATIN